MIQHLCNNAILDTCSFCPFPAIAVCPRCERLFCPDHIQSEDPQLLCLSCASQAQDYFANWGRWINKEQWLDIKTGKSYPVLQRRCGRLIGSRIDLWKYLEEYYKQKNGGMNLWTAYEKFFLEQGDEIGVSICRLRKSGLYATEQIHNAVNQALDGNQIDLAYELLCDAIKADPNQPTEYFQRGYIHINKRRYDEALTDFNRVVILDPNYLPGYLARIQANMVRKDYEAIEKDLGIFEQQNAIDPFIYHVRGITLARKVILFGETQLVENADSDLTRAIQEMPNNMIAQQIRGFVRLVTGREEEAADDLLAAMKDLGDEFTDLSYLFR